ncbi:alpha-L-arabinofuranosidase [Anaerolinea thermolimosa]|uniref:alpha-N-arabinofuranosidase n=1 Tax=Anaerolinea thermolimosa TaxID=229919 RepID=UPI000785CC99|nr:alpha-N-arabinofuranosidase [Anaerolinea thermolimosa]GAP06403.1 alpha-L-arabinofuranosidase [Anaerolinea thermolimosa]
MEKTCVLLDPGYIIAPVDPRIFGGFLEHLGRAIYGGIFDPQSSLADEHGFRKDVLAALHNLHLTTVRYPGGNFASGYHWMDGIGPKDKRPRARELAWQCIEPNQFGTDEFLGLARRMGWLPMITVNLGTGTPEEACNWVEYCNSPAGTRYADLRVANGSIDPYGVRLWCLGNEMDGPWQLGHLPAEQYALLASQTAKMMKDIDPTIELVACGSSTMSGPTYMEWDRIVLEYLGPQVEYISLHRYVGNPRGDTADYLAVTNTIDRRIEDLDAVCRFVQAKTRSKKRHYLCFDEWNVWYRTTGVEDSRGKGQVAPPLLEEFYNLEDALVVAGFLNSFIRHADAVKIANIAQMVNVIAPIHTRGDQILLQSIYYPLAMFSNRREGGEVALHPVVNGPAYESPSYGEVKYIDVSAILGDGIMHVFMINRSLNEDAVVEINPGGSKFESILSAEVVTGSSPQDRNTYEEPYRVISRSFGAGKVVDGKALVSLPPLSFVAFTLSIQ